MIADNRMTLGVNLPEHKDDQMLWSTSTPTDSNASIGYPDGAYTFSSGPDIIVGDFNVGSISSNDITKVELVAHFYVPDILTQDKVRISVIDNGVHDLVKTWSNTQSGLYYMSNGWSMELSGYENLSWDAISNLEIKLDYVSNGGSDDSQLRVDAVGINVENENTLVWCRKGHCDITPIHSIIGQLLILIKQRASLHHCQLRLVDSMQLMANGLQK